MEFLPQQINRRVSFESPITHIPTKVTIIDTKSEVAHVWNLILNPILDEQEWEFQDKYLGINRLDERDRQITILIRRNSLDVYVDGTWNRIDRSLIVDPVLFSIQDPKEFLCELFDDLLNVTFKIKMVRYA